ncbi:MAG: hypothetical protein ACREMG_15565 [Gemmatimonadales bacterium]
MIVRAGTAPLFADADPWTMNDDPGGLTTRVFNGVIIQRSEDGSAAWQRLLDSRTLPDGAVRAAG